MRAKAISIVGQKVKFGVSFALSASETLVRILFSYQIILVLYMCYCVFQYFQGNNDTKTVHKTVFVQTVFAHHARIWPTKWSNMSCMRIELYGKPPGNESGKSIHSLRNLKNK